LLMASACLVALLAECAPSRSATSEGSASSAVPTTPKRITTMILSDPPSLGPAVGPVPGRDELKQLVNVGLTLKDANGDRQLLLAESGPTVDNGLWSLLPDGRMETTWTLRPNVVRHDGSPLTTHDLAFNTTLLQDS